MSARTDVSQIREDLMRDLLFVRDRLSTEIHTDSDLGNAWAGVETFCVIALRVMAKTNPSKVRDEARTSEIGWLIKQATNNQGTK